MLQINTLTLQLPLGVTLEGSAKHGCFVAECMPGQSAAASGKMKPGLRLMSVNSKSTRGQSPGNVMDMIWSSVDTCRVVLAMDVANLTAFRKEDTTSILTTAEVAAPTATTAPAPTSAPVPTGVDYRPAAPAGMASADYRVAADRAQEGKGAYAEPIAMAAGANTGDNTGAAPQKATSQAKRKSRPAPLGPHAVAANDDDDNEQFFTPRETPGPLRAPLGHTAPPGE